MSAYHVVHGFQGESGLYELACFVIGGIELKSLKWRLALLGVVLLLGVVYLMPTLSPSLPQWWGRILPTEQIKLGLDLQGGMHLILEVQTAMAVENTVGRLTEEAREVLREERVPFLRVAESPGYAIEVLLPDGQRQADVKALFEKRLPVMEWISEASTDEGFKARLKMKALEVEHIEEMAAAQALQTIRNRIDQFGVSEPDIRPQGEDRILVQLPGVQDPQRAVSLIGRTATLEFKLVAEGVSPEEIQGGRSPAGVKVYSMRQDDAATGQRVDSHIALHERTLMTGEFITNAQVSIDHQYNTPYVSLEFDSQGSRMFERITGEHVRKRLAIVLDGVVYSAPVIQERISGGRASITGSFTMAEARDLAIVLRAGALPAPVTILEQRTVGPALGKDSIQKGFMACLVGGLAVVVFMIVYYKVSGLIANMALVLNIGLILAGLAALGATLTLPGIAGIALTIGMAVDANVLIYERVREEIRLGKTPRAAVESGYGKATKTIIDANMTTLIAAIVLFQFGTGPIKGFAITLTIGLLANLYTAIVVTRMVFDYLLDVRRARTVSI